MNKLSKAGIRVSGVFLGLFGLVSIYVYFLAPAEANLSGVFIVLFAMPWIFFYSHSPTASDLTRFLVTCIPVAINAGIIYFVVSRMQRETPGNPQV